MKTINAGMLRHKVILLKKTVTGQTNSGAEVIEWLPIGNTLASFHKLSARDFIAANAAQSQVSGHFVIRYRDIADGEYRLNWRGKLYKIVAFIPDEQSGRKTLTLPVSQQL